MDIMRNYPIKVLIGILLLIGKYTSAQSDFDNNSQAIWTQFKIKHQLTDVLKFSLEQQVRLPQNPSEISSYLVELGAEYQVVNFLSFKAQYRYTIFTEKRNQNRFSLDAKFEHKLKAINTKLNYRLRFQDVTVSYTGEKINYLRNQFSLKYNLSKRIDPFIAYESFYRFNYKNEFRINRYTAGVELKLNKHNDIEIFYRLDDEINVKQPEKQEVVGISFSTEL